MRYRLENLIPLPMVELNTSGSSIWEADSFSFIQGETYLVEAESGKGKTSLLSMMYGLRKDYSGNLYLDGNNARHFNAKEWSVTRKNRVSYIFQGLELFDDLSALENILLKNRITNFKTEKQIVDMAEHLNVAGFLHKKSGILSFGQRQRMAIVRALCQPFEFLLADECFSHIDKKHEDAALKLIISESNRQNAGFILTSLGNNLHEFDHHLKL
ncbi:MAG: ATP-binding cassette domain-containing protein [Bacteroidales bacterium]|nr:ATP-binding cassette domain-containing protein [Bacteroidales bacterium]